MSSNWKILFDPRAEKSLKKLDRSVKNKIIRYLEERIENANDPRDFGDALTGNKLGLWRYRVQDYRIICRIKDDMLIVLVLEVGHRKNVYH